MGYRGLFAAAHSPRPSAVHRDRYTKLAKNFLPKNRDEKTGDKTE